MRRTIRAAAVRVLAQFFQPARHSWRDRARLLDLHQRPGRSICWDPPDAATRPAWASGIWARSPPRLALVTLRVEVPLAAKMPRNQASRKTIACSPLGHSQSSRFAVVHAPAQPLMKASPGRRPGRRPRRCRPGGHTGPATVRAPRKGRCGRAAALAGPRRGKPRAGPEARQRPRSRRGACPFRHRRYSAARHRSGRRLGCGGGPPRAGRPAGQWGHRPGAAKCGHQRPARAGWRRKPGAPALRERTGPRAWRRSARSLPWRPRTPPRPWRPFSSPAPISTK